MCVTDHVNTIFNYPFFFVPANINLYTYVQCTYMHAHIH